MPDTTVQMQSLVTEDGRLEVSLVEVPLPEPGPKEVVVEVQAAPLNPSDLILLLGGADPSTFETGGTADRPVLTAQLPADRLKAAGGRLGQSLPVGNEGAGVVVAAGAEAQDLIGKTVALAGGSMYATHRVVHSAACLVLPDGATARDGAASFVNPMTALGMVATMRNEGHTGLVHTAAASNLGQMLNRLCQSENVPLVNIVRSAAQVKILKDDGAAYVVDSSVDSFRSDLVEALAATGATMAFDAIGGGDMVDTILTAMEKVATQGQEWSRYGSTAKKQVYVYGVLAQGPTLLNRTYGFTWGVGGWLLTPFLAAAGREALGAMRQQVADNLTTIFASAYTDTVSLTGSLQAEAVKAYGAMATGRKYLIEPAS